MHRTIRQRAVGQRLASDVLLESKIFHHVILHFQQVFVLHLQLNDAPFELRLPYQHIIYGLVNIGEGLHG